MRLAKTPKTALKYALKKMNNSGAHWIKGQMQGVKHGEEAFCSVGGVRAVAGGSRTPVCNGALILLAEQIKPFLMRKHREALVARSKSMYWTTDEARADFIQRNLADWAQRYVIEWNDAESRRWRDIEKKFTAAIEAA
jgi:hypothetical protein